MSKYGPPGKSEAAEYYENLTEAVARALKHIHREESDETSEEFVKRGRYSQYATMLRQMAEEAQAFAKTRGMSPDQFWGGPLSDAIDVCEQLRAACHFGEDDPKLDFIVWQHQHFSVANLKTVKVPPIDRDPLEATVGRYLRLPFRVQMVDRIMVDALIAYETLHYANEMFGTPPFALFPSRSPVKQRHVFVSWLFGNFWNVVFFGGLAALIFYLGSANVIGSGWALGIGLTLIGVLLVLSAISVISLPFAWRSQARARAKVGELMLAMMTTYTELVSEGPVSAIRIHELATGTAAKGVAWPASLFALLEDIKARGGKF